jgi:hypothetical protein
VQQRDPDPDHNNSRLYGTLGLFCSLPCLLAEAAAWAASTKGNP